MRRDTVAGLIWGGAGMLLRLTINVFIVAILARLLSPTDYGMYAAAALLIGISGGLAGMGIGPALIQRPNISNEDIGAAIGASICVGVVVSAVLWLFAPAFAAAFRTEELIPIIRWLSVLLTVRSVVAVAEAVISRELRFKVVALLSSLPWIATSVAITVPLACNGLGAWSLVWGALSEATLSLVAYVIALKIANIPFFPRFQGIPFILRRSLSFGMAKVFGNVGLYGDSLVVGQILGPTQLGIYSRGVTLVSIPANLIERLSNTVILPVFAKLHSMGRTLDKGVFGGLSLASVSLVPLGVFILVYSEDVVLLILGERWVDAQVPLALFALAAYFRVGTQIISSALQADGNSLVAAVMQVMQTGLIVVAAGIGVRWGIGGAAGAVGLALVASFLTHALLYVAGERRRAIDLVAAHAGCLLLSLWILGSKAALEWIGFEAGPGLTVISAAALSAVFPVISLMICVRASSPRAKRVARLTGFDGLRRSLEPTRSGTE